MTDLIFDEGDLAYVKQDLSLDDKCVVMRDHLFAEMKKKAVTRIIVHFAGGGDSGQIEDLEWEGLHKEADVELNTMQIDPPLKGWESAGRAFDPATQTWSDTYHEKTYDNLQSLAEDVSYGVLKATDLDWYNNDGGQGNIIFWITPEGKNQIEADVGVNYMQTTHHHYKMEA